MYEPASNQAGSPGGGPPGEPGSRNQRYTYLVGRLRSRQITMEEATELFSMMQGMLTRANEMARVAAARQAPAFAPAPSALAPIPPPPPSRGGVSSSSDDLLLVGILAMGAGAGLLAALSKRMGAPPSSPTAPSGSERSTSSAASR
ncbi:MAG: hypothetical protein ACRECT_08615 [Thermoplasmata archaeon]